MSYKYWFLGDIANSQFQARLRYVISNKLSCFVSCSLQLLVGGVKLAKPGIICEDYGSLEVRSGGGGTSTQHIP